MVTACRNCGKEVQPDAKYCSYCGMPILESKTSGARIPFDDLLEDRVLQRYWIIRVVAYLIDLVLVGFFTIIIYGLTGRFLPYIAPPNPFAFFPTFEGVAYGVIMVIYAALAETYYGKTFGKRLMGMSTLSDKNIKPSLRASLLRNITKIHWVLLLLDVLMGMITKGGVHERYLDRIASTRVALA